MEMKELIARNLEKQIQRALTPAPGQQPSHITVAVHGRRATLNGTVGSWAEHEAAEHITLSTPGVAAVENHLYFLVKPRLSPQG